MLLLRIACMATVLSGISVFGMEISSVDFHDQFIGFFRCHGIVHNNHMPDRALVAIKEQFNKHAPLTVVLNDKKLTGQVLDLVGENCKGFWRETAGFGCRDRESFYKELAAAVLGTPGAIEFGKEYIKDNDKAKKNLRWFLFNIVTCGHEPDERGDGCTFENEGLDIIKAAFDMGLDINIFDKEWPILVAAARENKPKTIDFLIERGADVNAINGCGQTPLIAAAESCCVEIVQKLLGNEKTLVWLLDGYDKTALDYAKEKLDCYQNDEDSEPYKIIVELLEDAQKKLPVLIKQ